MPQCHDPHSGQTSGSSFIVTSSLAIRHVAFEDLGTLAPVLDQSGIAPRYLDGWSPDLAHVDPVAPDLVVVLGGPIGVYEVAAYPWLAHEIAWLRTRLLAGRPTLGICLGAQLIAAALGARVYPGPSKELGWMPLQLSAAGRDSALAPLDGELTSMLHWHGDTFDLPEGAQLLASTASYRHQAYQWQQHVLGLQCHPELDGATFERWLVGHALELAQTGVDVPALRAETAARSGTLARQAALAWRRWLAGVGLASAE